eukprot:755259-Hanusia_phi.AAC.7
MCSGNKCWSTTPLMTPTLAIILPSPTLPLGKPPPVAWGADDYSSLVKLVCGMTARPRVKSSSH